MVTCILIMSVLGSNKNLLLLLLLLLYTHLQIEVLRRNICRPVSSLGRGTL